VHIDQLQVAFNSVQQNHDITSGSQVAKDHKSPAVASVSRPYAWCTLATCVHNCPSMMFRTWYCLRPKCKRSYLLIYITSGSYVNNLCKQVKRPIPRRNTCVANCGQTAAVSDMVTIDSL